MAGIPNRIKNDAEYVEVLDRMVKGAEMIDHPLTKSDRRIELMKVYDALSDAAIAYRQHPDVRAGREPVYEMQLPDKPPAVAETPDPQPSAININLSDWL